MLVMICNEFAPLLSGPISGILKIIQYVTALLALLVPLEQIFGVAWNREI
jgi:hypothetical protein